MRFFANMSLRGKLTAVVTVTTCLALMASLAFLGVWDSLNFRLRLQHDALTRAEIIANNSTAGLSFGDAQPVNEVLQALAADPHLGAAVVFNSDGSVFAKFVRPGWEVPKPSIIKSRNARFDENFLEIYQPITIRGQRLGTVLTRTDLLELEERRNLGLLVGLGVLAAGGGLGYLLARRLQRPVSQPVLDLVKIARSVAAEKNYKVRVPVRSGDELGQLVEAFNEMLAQIETRDEALQEAHAELERRVMLRTTEFHEANEMLQREVEAHKRARAESDALRDKLQTAYERLQSEADERAEVQEALRRSEERFSKAFRASPVPLAILTRTSCAFVDVNDRFAELVGNRRDQIIGKTMFDVPLWSLPETKARVEQLLDDGQPLRNWECRVLGDGNESRSALLSAETFMLGSEPCVLLMTEDISERVNLEGQLRHAQKMDAIGQLASGVAHDFNNLLTIIQGYTQLVLAMQTGGGMVREALEKVTSASQRAAQLTGQLLTFSRKQIAQPKPLDLNKVVTNVLGMLHPLLGERVKLNWQPAASVPSIEGDSGMLEQVLVNLAVNARDAMPRGGNLIISTFTCELDAIQLQAHPQARAGEFVCVQVSDTGSGMSSETLERIFEPFFTTKGVGKGTGLGLATVYGIIKQHRGWVEVVSTVGVGTTFKIFLPATETMPVQSQTRNDPGRVTGGNETILVVEDEPALRVLVTSILRNFGYHVIEASHGPEALGIWQQAKTKPELLLTDMMMPEGMTGWELAERLRADEPKLKVVYTSGYSTELFGGHVQLNDRSNFLPKPFHPHVLAKTVRQCLDN